MPRLQCLKTRVWVAPFLLTVLVVCGGQAPVPEPATDQETELGQEIYKELTNKGEIIESSPLYDTLRPIADSISRVAQSRYSHPFKFYLVHETQPNAFATPGGNVYVVDSLLYFVKNTDVLASYGPGAKVKLDEICKIMGLAGKPPGIDGSQVEAMVNAGQIDEVAQYCESDVLNTYRVWLVYEHFRGTITTAQLEWSEAQIREFLRTRKLANPHLNVAIGIASIN
jgi:hypothetical protein